MVLDPALLGSVGSLAWGAMSAVAGSVAIGMSDRHCVAMLRAAQQRLAGLRGIPGNHDVARALRMAQLQALERVIRDFRAAASEEWHPVRRARLELFFERSLEFCGATVGRSLVRPTVRLNLELTPALHAAIDGLLISPADDGPADRRLRAAAAVAEDAVLGELRGALHGVALPEGFEDHFREGGAGKPRFLDAFGAYVNEQLKENAPFQAMFMAGHLVNIESLAIDARELLRRLDDRYGAILERIAAQLITQSTQLSAIQQQLATLVADRTGVPVRAVAAILARMGEADVPEDKIEMRLAAKAEEYLALRAKWERVSGMTELHPDVAAVRVEALSRIDAGDLDGARALFQDARERVRDCPA